MTAKRTGPGSFCGFHCSRLPQRVRRQGRGQTLCCSVESQQAQEEERRTIRYSPRGVFTPRGEMTADQSGLCFRSLGGQKWKKQDLSDLVLDFVVKYVMFWSIKQVPLMVTQCLCGPIVETNPDIQYSIKLLFCYILAVLHQRITLKKSSSVFKFQPIHKYHFVKL